SAQTGNEGSAVTFNGSGSSDADGDALTYRWDFGDGTTQNTSSATVQHIYDDNGSYVVTLMVTDAPGATSAPATTSAVIANVAPTATLVAPTGPTPEGPITLSLTLPHDAAGDLSTLQYAFDCGDGLGFSAFASSPSASCYGWDNGTLTVRAQVRDKDGATSPVYTAAISLVNVAPTVTMISAPATGTAGVNYTIQYKFTDPGTKDSPWYYQPNWGDGKKLSLNTASTQGQTITQAHIYSSPGTYTVTVKVIDKDGSSGSTSFLVTIR
ncbi:MAG TPA: PKD domain-containing protein, partial [Gemmatimonadaceae bacterium]|nr:PKD domain-containing protein [Gemmatimonadaceae bacterium]